jgi:hypothetical protein
LDFPTGLSVKHGQESIPQAGWCAIHMVKSDREEGGLAVERLLGR